MGVRVRVAIRHGSSTVTTTALVNSGYESEEAEVHIPLALARRLGLSLERLRAERYRAVGHEVSAYVLGRVEVRVITEDRQSEWVRARAVSVPGEMEVLLGDAIIEELGIEIVKPRSGLWRFAGEEGVRGSEEPEYWVE